jgi:hypothetical protein
MKSSMNAIGMIVVVTVVPRGPCGTALGSEFVPSSPRVAEEVGRHARSAGPSGGADDRGGAHLRRTQAFPTAAA